MEADISERLQALESSYKKKRIVEDTPAAATVTAATTLPPMLCTGIN